MNKVAKGSRKEKECLEMFKRYFKLMHPNWELKREWKVIHIKFQNMDYLSDWDLGLLYHYKIYERNVIPSLKLINRKKIPLSEKKALIIPIEIKIQSKTGLLKKTYEEFQNLYKGSGSYCYLAFYGHEPKSLPKSQVEHFEKWWLVRVDI